VDGKLNFFPDSPPWIANRTSSFTAYVKSIFEKKTNKEIWVSITPAGVEPCYFTNKMPDMQAVTLGPTCEGGHSPNERANLPDMIIFYDIVKNIIKNLPQATS